MDKHAIIRLKNEGKSNRKVSELLNIDRKTVAKYWNEHQKLAKLLEDPEQDHKLIQEKMNADPSYDSSSRRRTKYTKELDQCLNQILESEARKDEQLKNHKQALTNVQIHKILVDKGFDISYPSVCNYLREKRKKIKECFIKQKYDYGDRLEFDFGEVKLMIKKELRTYYLAVLSSPASGFRWAYLYPDQKQNSFLDSQIRFFEMVGGMYRELVYDNMKNVVNKFIGRNEKELNKKLLELANYYGFQVNVTNCFSGNEKGHVEGSVKIIRREVFASRYEFDSIDEAEEYLQSKLIEMNEKSLIEEEKEKLLPLRPRFELVEISQKKVDKYSFIQVENKKYSVPDHLVGETLTVRNYTREISIYVNNKEVARHKKKDGTNEASVEIRHFLPSLARKPGAVRNSLALKSIPLLKSIFDKHFTTEAEKFVEILIQNKDKDMDGIIDAFGDYIKFTGASKPKDIIKSPTSLEIKTRKMMKNYNDLCLGAGR